MQEAQEVEVLRLSLASGTSIGSCIASKLNDPSLVGMEFQRELTQPFAKLSQEPLGVPAILEANNKVSNPEESHLRVLSEPDVNVSAHPAPIIQPPAAAPSANARTVHDHVERRDRASESHGDGAYEVS